MTLPYVPEKSRLPGVRRWAREQGLEVVLNFNTPEFASFQYAHGELTIGLAETAGQVAA